MAVARRGRAAAWACCAVVAVSAGLGACTSGDSAREEPRASDVPGGGTPTALPALQSSPDVEYTVVATASGRGGKRTIAFQSVLQDAAYRVTAACLGRGVLVVQLGSAGWEVACTGLPAAEIFSAPPNTKSAFVAAESETEWRLIVQRFNQS